MSIVVEPILLGPALGQTLGQILGPIFAEPAPVSKSTLWLARIAALLVLLAILIEKLVQWPVVTGAVERFCFDSGERLARSVGFVGLVCTALQAMRPASTVTAIRSVPCLASISWRSLLPRYWRFRDPVAFSC